MSLRTRLILGYGFLVLLVLVVAATATVGFFDLSGQIEALTPSVAHGTVEAAGASEPTRISDALNHAQETSTRYGAAMAALVGLGLLTFIVLTRALQRRVLDRLSEIKEVASEVGAGNSHRRVSVEIDDELGDVGRQLNRALDRYVELERHVDGRVSEIKQNILGLFDTLEIEGAFFNLDGSLVASTLTTERDALPDELEQRIVEEGRQLVESRQRELGDDGRFPRRATTVKAPDGSTISIELVHAYGQRLVGWLARRAEPSQMG